jgi:hypothetical protein
LLEPPFEESEEEEPPVEKKFSKAALPSL